ncbi:hypothetical protein KFE25_006014 [Diacronema lutheri]|uniref:Uncharacterized protein n=1 Tax=Diacronema lutheri TaxID=2081491 RepID=A0A8J5XS80_DIALT|nr:hypothetical protein KFE25_006014 [Diacronema lutheri]
MALAALALLALGWQGCSPPRLSASRLRSSVVALAGNEKGGFGQAPKPKSKAPPAPPLDAVRAEVPNDAARAPRYEAGAESVLARAGITRTSSSRQLRDAAFKEPTVPSTAQPAPPPPGPLASVPMEVQNQMEQVFVTFCGLALVFFITCGFATIEDAYLTVTKSEPPAFVAPILPFLSKSFTPSLGGVLACSITLGIFKQAQFSDPGTGLVYKEEDE